MHFPLPPLIAPIFTPKCWQVFASPIQHHPTRLIDMLFLGSVWFHSEASFDPGQKPIDAKKTWCGSSKYVSCEFDVLGRGFGFKDRRLSCVRTIATCIITFASFRVLSFKLLVTATIMSGTDLKTIFFVCEDALHILCFWTYGLK